MKILNKLAEFKQCIIRIVIHRFYYTNGCYKIYGIMDKKWLRGIVVYSPNRSVYRKFQFVKTYKYHLDTDVKPQWYLVNGV